MHCGSDPSILASVYYKHPPVLIKVVDNRTLNAHAVGTVILPLVAQHNREHHITLHNVIIPTFTLTSLVRRLWRYNLITFLFDPHNFMQEASIGVRVPITFDRQCVSSYVSYVSSLCVADDDIPHSRFAHATEGRLNQLPIIGFPKLSRTRISLEPIPCDAFNACWCLTSSSFPCSHRSR